MRTTKQRLRLTLLLALPIVALVIMPLVAFKPAIEEYANRLRDGGDTAPDSVIVNHDPVKGDDSLLENRPEPVTPKDTSQIPPEPNGDALVENGVATPLSHREPTALGRQAFVLKDEAGHESGEPEKPKISESVNSAVFDEAYLQQQSMFFQFKDLLEMDGLEYIESSDSPIPAILEQILRYLDSEKPPANAREVITEKVAALSAQLYSEIQAASASGDSDLAPIVEQYRNSAYREIKILEQRISAVRDKYWSVEEGIHFEAEQEYDLLFQIAMVCQSSRALFLYTYTVSDGTPAHQELDAKFVEVQKSALRLTREVARHSSIAMNKEASSLLAQYAASMERRIKKIAPNTDLSKEAA